MKTLLLCLVGLACSLAVTDDADAFIFRRLRMRCMNGDCIPATSSRPQRPSPEPEEVARLPKAPRPLPARPPLPPVPPAPPAIDIDKVVERVVTIIKADITMQGKDGMDGRDGMDGAPTPAMDYEELATILLSKIEHRLPAPPPAEEHLVLVMSLQSEHLPEARSAAQGCGKPVRLLPPPLWDIGPLPQLVHYRNGVAIKTYKSLPNVVGAFKAMKETRVSYAPDGM